MRRARLRLLQSRPSLQNEFSSLAPSTGNLQAYHFTFSGRSPSVTRRMCALDHRRTFWWRETTCALFSELDQRGWLSLTRRERLSWGLASLIRPREPFPACRSQVCRYVRPERLALAIVAAFLTRWYHYKTSASDFGSRSVPTKNDPTSAPYLSATR